MLIVILRINRIVIFLGFCLIFIIGIAVEMGVRIIFGIFVGIGAVLLVFRIVSCFARFRIELITCIFGCSNCSSMNFMSLNYFCYHFFIIAINWLLAFSSLCLVFTFKIEFSVINLHLFLLLKITIFCQSSPSDH